MTQNSVSGANDLTAATATRINFEVKTTSEESLRNWIGVQAKIIEAVEDFNDASSFIDTGLTSSHAINYFMLRNVIRSAGFIAGGLILMIIYSFIVFSGGFGPVRCRCNLGWLAMLTLIMSMLAGFGLATVVADRIRFVAFSFLLFYVISSLGLTYMFLISKTVDQHFFYHDDVPFLMQRVMEDIASSVLLGATTSCVAMFIGAFTIFRGFESICIFGGMSIACLLFAVLTMYTAAVAFDLWR